MAPYTHPVEISNKPGLHYDPNVVEAMRGLVLKAKSEGVGYHEAIQVFIDEAIRACELFTEHPPQFYKFMSTIQSHVKTGILVAGDVYGMPEALVITEAMWLSEVIVVNCAR